MHRSLLFLIISLLIYSCKNGPVKNSEPVFTATDSTKIVKTILDSLHAEMNTQWFMDSTFKVTTCHSFPIFTPALRILLNGNGDIMIQGDLNNKNIVGSILNFYSANLFKNDYTNNYPNYLEISKKQILSTIKYLEEQITELKQNKSSLELIERNEKELDEWKDKLKILTLLSVDILREPAYTAGVELKYPEKSSVNEQILDSVLLGFYKIREIDAKIYFKESYAKIFWKATKHNDTLAINQLKAFKVLHPVYVLDYGKSKIPTSEMIPPPPPVE